MTRRNLMAMLAPAIVPAPQIGVRVKPGPHSVHVKMLALQLHRCGYLKTPQLLEILGVEPPR